MADKKEYIERGALIRLFDERYITAIVQQKHDDVPEDHKKHWKGVQSGTNWCKNTVLEAPAADVVSLDDVREAFQTYILEMTCSKYGTPEETQFARDIVRQAVDIVLGERK